MNKISYQAFLEWKDEKGLSYERLAELSKMHGAPITAQAISGWVRKGELFQSNVIMALADAFRWDMDTIGTFFFNKKTERQEPATVITIPLGKPIVIQMKGDETA